jgi:hypothetical protein
MKLLPDHIQIATANNRKKTVFTYEYGYYQQKYGWEAKAFIAHCLSRWNDEFEHLMDDWEPDHEDYELEIVDYWGPRLAEEHKEVFPQCDADFYRNVWRAKLRSLILPQNLINDYFEKVGFPLLSDQPEMSREYFSPFKYSFGTDLKPLPPDWIGFGFVDQNDDLIFSQEILKLKRNTDSGQLLQTISWLLSGFIINFPLFTFGPNQTVRINSDLCKTLSRNFPEYSGTGNLDAAWFEGIFRAKFLSVKMPLDLMLKVL